MVPWLGSNAGAPTFALDASSRMGGFAESGGLHRNLSRSNNALSAPRTRRWAPANAQDRHHYSFSAVFRARCLGRCFMDGAQLATGLPVSQRCARGAGCFLCCRRSHRALTSIDAPRPRCDARLPSPDPARGRLPETAGSGARPCRRPYAGIELPTININDNREPRDRMVTASDISTLRSLRP